MDDIIRWWGTLEEDKQRAYVAGAVALLTVRALGAGKALLLCACAWYLSTRVPTEASFLPWFERWFKAEYFPGLAERLKHELSQRAARRTSILDRLSDKVNSWLVGSTKGLQASFVYELLDKRVMFSSLVVLRLASVNLGSRASPSHVSFVGVHDTWMLAPWHRLDFDNMSILDEVDPSVRPSAGRGGAR